MAKHLHTVHLDGVVEHLWHAVKHLVETAVAPLLLFYLLFHFTGLTGGLLAALAWAAGALTWRLVRGVRIPMVLLITTGLLVVRSVLGYFTHSPFFYFIEPSLQNFLIAGIFLVTMPFERTLIGKLADDFCGLPPTVTRNARVQRFFRRVSVLWALVFLVNGVGTLWALAESTIGEFLLVSTAGSWSVVALAAIGSIAWLRRVLHGEGIRIRFGARTAATG